VEDAQGGCLDHRHGATVQLVEAARYRTLDVGLGLGPGFHTVHGESVKVAHGGHGIMHAPKTEKVASSSTTATAMSPVFSAMVALQPRPPSPPWMTSRP